MPKKTPLTEEEKRYLNALKLFMERNEDPEHLEDRIVLDELSPEKARAMIVLHHIWLEDPPVVFFGLQVIYVDFANSRRLGADQRYFFVVKCGAA